MSGAQTPSQQIISRANTPGVVIDEKNRKIEVLPLNGSSLSRFMMICGKAPGESPDWFYASLVRCYVVSIDGIPVPPVGSIDQVHGLWDIVDAEATAAALKYAGEIAKAGGPEAAKN